MVMIKCFIMKIVQCCVIVYFRERGFIDLELDEIRRILQVCHVIMKSLFKRVIQTTFIYSLQIISTNRVDDASEILHLSSVLERANISSNNGYYEKLMRNVAFIYRTDEKKRQHYLVMICSLLKMQLSPNCSKMAVHCAWENKEENCADIIETESTDDGYCCSFNSVILYRNRSTNRKK